MAKKPGLDPGFFLCYVRQMIHLLGKIPHEVSLACSGGVDSMAVLDFLINGKKKVRVLNFNHGTAYGWGTQAYLREYCAERDLEFVTKNIKAVKGKRQSQEEFWREERYAFLRANSGDRPIITCHHLDDCVETWIFTALRGNPRVIPYENDGVIRPFLLTPKKKLEEWAERKNVLFFDDPSNCNDKYMRNLIRRHIVPRALEVNPGLRKTVAKIVAKNNKHL